MEKFTLALAVVLALAVSPRMGQDPAQPPVPPENAARPPAPSAGYRAIFQAGGQRRATGRSEPLFLQPGQ